MDTIKSLMVELEKNSGNRLTIEEKLQVEYNKIFDDNGDLLKALNQLETSKEYGMLDNEVYSWVRFDLSDFQDCRQYLDSWLADRCTNADWDNDALISLQGGTVLINDDGDVYDTDSGKFIVDRADYQDDEKRNSLIETWMEKNGYFPGVFHTDGNGNVFPVDTTKPQE